MKYKDFHQVKLKLFLPVLFKTLLEFISKPFLSISSAYQIRLSNESVKVKSQLDQAEKDITEMVQRNISILRVNETYQEARQLYSAQRSLEEKGESPSYKRVLESVQEIRAVKETALKADDELKVFKEFYSDVENETNLSEMQEEYNQIVLSFHEERFEETLALIQKWYGRVSEVQSSQTLVKAAYLSTSKTIKDFFLNNWKKIAIISLLTASLIFIFWNRLNKLMQSIRFNHLTVQKRAIAGLLQETQKEYFKDKKMSEREYKIKLQKYREITREIDRQLLVLKEERFKLENKKS